MNKFFFYLFIQMFLPLPLLMGEFPAEKMHVMFEYLLMRDSRGQPYFAFSNHNNDIDDPRGQLFANPANWHSGYRIEGSYSLCEDNKFDIRWTHFPFFSNVRLVNDAPLVEIIGGENAGIAISNKDKFTLYNVEFIYDHHFCLFSPFSFSLLAGVQFSHVFVEEKLNLFGNPFVPRDTVVENIFKSSRNGIGPLLGISSTYYFCPSILAKMRASGTLMIARNKQSWKEDITISKISDEPYWIPLPFFDMSLGVQYKRNCISLEIGYEIFTYFHALGRFYSFDQINFYETFSLYGPYFQFAFFF